jgi:hypothetical protein
LDFIGNGGTYKPSIAVKPILAFTGVVVASALLLLILPKEKNQPLAIPYSWEFWETWPNGLGPNGNPNPDPNRFWKWALAILLGAGVGTGIGLCLVVCTWGGPQPQETPVPREATQAPTITPEVPTATPTDDNDEYLFRGTTVGYEGSGTTNRLSITSITRHPGVATLFASEATTKSGGEGIIYVFRASDLNDLNFVGGNVLEGIEREIGVDILPLDLVNYAYASISLNGARSVLASMSPPINIPSRAYKDEMNSMLESMRDMSRQEIEIFVQAARGMP